MILKTVHKNHICFRFSVKNDWDYSQRKTKATNFSTSFPDHSDQLFYIFRLSAYPKWISDQDYQNLSKDSLPRQIIKNITNFYMNFAKFG